VISINELFNNRKIRKLFLKIRYPLFAAALLLVLTQLDPRWFLPGLVVSVLGELLQVWCFATIKTQKKLTQEGPYMFMRNPMYIGRFLLLFGMVMMTANPWILGGFVLLYYFYMTNRVRREEAKLQQIFGADYEAYCRRVNRYLPGLAAFRPEKLTAVSWESFYQNNAHLNMLMILGCYGILFIATFVRPLG